MGNPPTCQPHALVGQTCGEGVSCAGGLVCVGGNSTTTGVCQPAIPTLGAACPFTSSDDTCDMNAGVSCSAVTGTCQTAKFGPAGAACNVVADQWAYSAVGRCSDGDCVAFAPLGGPCEVLATLSTCISPAICVSADGGTTGTCQLHGASACQ